ncbi:MAG: DivIVA domain-containing protein [bacterium]
MPVTPLEIRKKEFAKALRGYSPDEVRAFLAAIAAEVEELRRERSGLAEKVEELTAQVQAYGRAEKLLQDTLVTAQKATGDLRDSAERNARNLEAEAQVRADRMLLEARRESDKMREQIRTLAARRSALTHEIAAVARTYLSLAESMDKKPDNDDEPADSAEPAGDTE